MTGGAREGAGGGAPTGRVDGERVYSGRRIHVDVDRVRFPDGSIGRLELIRHPGASAVVALDLPDPPDRTAAAAREPIVTLVRQYRYAARGFIWEVPAGNLEPGEPPEACALRELEEEAGLRAGRLERLASVRTTPGFTDEVIHLFAAWDLEAGETSHEASEFMDVHRLPLRRTIEMIDAGEISDGKTICALTLAARWVARRMDRIGGRGV
ncbi:MAG: NUDIX hydrolase [Gemmatimonadota bacterium]|uniref:NUDIX hydrolase n=1 Tax=Candidatus Palauibacter scopulicola TaxID=3056741 RepID=UPI002398F29B|nr:NUDIX hydrolase [Candidatus Palauibacter scopulicola]MDE2663625.1 NUDIX hydrolase [Candidatus Palauibacter scopulicola]